MQLHAYQGMSELSCFPAELRCSDICELVSLECLWQMVKTLAIEVC